MAGDTDSRVDAELPADQAANPEEPPRNAAFQPDLSRDAAYQPERPYDVNPREAPREDAAQPAPAPRRAAHASGRPAYVHEPRHHRTQPPVNDVQADDTFEHQYAHDSSYTLSSRSPISRGAYRRARSSETKIRQELKYGQYLSVPKGNREIFASHDRTRRNRLLVVCAVVVVIAIVALIVLWPK